MKKYDVFLRELNTQNRTRINAVRLQLIPDPATLLVWSLLAGLGIGLGWRHREHPGPIRLLWPVGLFFWSAAAY